MCDYVDNLCHFCSESQPILGGVVWRLGECVATADSGRVAPREYHRKLVWLLYTATDPHTLL